jgi:hypothetical protein
VKIPKRDTHIADASAEAYPRDLGAYPRDLGAEEDESRGADRDSEDDGEILLMQDPEGNCVHFFHA